MLVLQMNLEYVVYWESLYDGSSYFTSACWRIPKNILYSQLYSLRCSYELFKQVIDFVSPLHILFKGNTKFWYGVMVMVTSVQMNILELSICDPTIFSGHCRG